MSVNSLKPSANLQIKCTSHWFYDNWRDFLCCYRCGFRIVVPSGRSERRLPMYLELQVGSTGRLGAKSYSLRLDWCVCNALQVLFCHPTDCHPSVLTSPTSPWGRVSVGAPCSAVIDGASVSIQWRRVNINYCSLVLSFAIFFNYISITVNPQRTIRNLVSQLLKIIVVQIKEIYPFLTSC